MFAIASVIFAMAQCVPDGHFCNLSGSTYETVEACQAAAKLQTENYAKAGNADYGICVFRNKEDWHVFDPTQNIVAPANR